MKLRVFILAMLVLAVPTTKTEPITIGIGFLACALVAWLAKTGTEKVTDAVEGERSVNKQLEKEKLREWDLVSSETRGGEKVFDINAKELHERARELQIEIEASQLREQVILTRENIMQGCKETAELYAQELDAWVQTKNDMLKVSEELRIAERQTLHLRGWFASMGQWLWSCIRQHEDFQREYTMRQKSLHKAFRLKEDSQCQEAVSCST